MSVRILQGDCRSVMAEMPEASIDAIVTDPPYELGFMGKGWDATGVANDSATWRAALRVLKPGGHLLAFSGTRTYHRMVCAIEDAGFEIRDQIGWLYGSGFPKSLDVSKAIDKVERGAMVRSKLLHFATTRGVDGRWLESHGVASASSFTDWTTGGHVPSDKNWQLVRLALGVTPEEEAAFEREVVGRSTNGIAGGTGRHAGQEGAYGFAAEFDETIGATDAARQWQGWGTALKPCWECIVVARRPLVGTVASNVLRFGTGALNIDACRVEAECDTDRTGIGCSVGTRAASGNSSLSTAESGEKQTGQSLTGARSTTKTRTEETTPSETSNASPATSTPSDTGSTPNEQRNWRLALDSNESAGQDESSTPLGLSENAPEDGRSTTGSKPLGRWPGNVIHDGSDEVLAAFPDTRGGWLSGSSQRGLGYHGAVSEADGTRPATKLDDGGSAARFFYTAKASAYDRNDGTYDLRPQFAPTMGNGIGGKEHDPETATKKGNHHPTVKPTDLMRYLCRLVTPPGGTVLDPFMGSGSTLKAAELEGFSAIGIELDPAYIEIAKRRIASDAPLFAEVA